MSPVAAGGHTHEADREVFRRVWDGKRDLAARAAIQHAIAALADTLTHGNDLLVYLDDHERAVRLAACVGDICTDLAENRGLGQDAALLRLAAEVQLALEVRERERVAA